MILIVSQDLLNYLFLCAARVDFGILSGSVPTAELKNRAVCTRGEFEKKIQPLWFESLLFGAFNNCKNEATELPNSILSLMYSAGNRTCKSKLLKFFDIVVKALWNALRGRHKYGATSGNQYAARRCSMITRLTRNLSVTGSSLQWSSNFCSLQYYWRGGEDNQMFKISECASLVLEILFSKFLQWIAVKKKWEAQSRQRIQLRNLMIPKVSNANSLQIQWKFPL